jgi:histidinol-phosphatase (PHP family)
VLDYHLHLWAHGQPAGPVGVEHLAAYCGQAASRGVAEIAVTEHLFRFRQARAALGGFWDDDPDPRLRRTMAAYWDEHATADLDAYVEVVERAKAEGLPVVLGLEVDHYAGRMDQVAALLRGYPFDVLLGSVHWLGAWGFDDYEDPVVAAEWDVRSTDEVWSAYADAVEELATSRACDVLAHPDVCKVTGRVPVAVEETHDRVADALTRHSMAAEVSSTGWRKPVGEAYPAPGLLARLRARGVAVTTASDAHTLADVEKGVARLVPLLREAGYDTVTAFRGRRREEVTLGHAHAPAAAAPGRQP